MGYELPAGNVPVSSSWWDHANRNPPSSEPGTDYACAYGTVVVAVDNGTITHTKTSNGSATGRYVEYDTDSGGDGRTLHMAEVWVGPGQRVNRGQPLGLSGASGYGSDWYYGPHAHQTAWPGPAWAAPTIDFETLVGGGTPPPDITIGEDDSMWLIWYGDTGPVQGWLICPTAQVGVSNPRDYALLKRIITSNQSAEHPEHFNFAEQGIINGYVRQLAAETARNAG